MKNFHIEHFNNVVVFGKEQIAVLNFHVDLFCATFERKSRKENTYCEENPARNGNPIEILDANFGYYIFVYENMKVSIPDFVLCCPIESYLIHINTQVICRAIVCGFFRLLTFRSRFCVLRFPLIPNLKTFTHTRIFLIRINRDLYDHNRLITIFYISKNNKFETFENDMFKNSNQSRSTTNFTMHIF